MNVKIKENKLLRRLCPTFTTSIKWIHYRLFQIGDGEKNMKLEQKWKMDQEQWLQIKMLFLLGYNLKTVI